MSSLTMSCIKITEETLIDLLKDFDESQLKKIFEKVRVVQEKEKNANYHNLTLEFDELRTCDTETINKILTIIRTVAFKPHILQMDYIRHIKYHYNSYVNDTKRRQQKSCEDLQQYIMLSEHYFNQLREILESLFVITDLPILNERDRINQFYAKLLESVKYFMKSVKLLDKKGFKLSHVLDHIFEYGIYTRD